MSISTQHDVLEEAPSPAPLRTAEASGSAIGGAIARPKQILRTKYLVFALLAVGVLLVVAAAVTLLSDLTGSDQLLIYYTVQQGDLPITVTERGNLESQENLKITCEVDEIEDDGIRGTPILWIIPNGSSVKEGELLVEFDMSTHLERLDRQILDTEKSRAEQIQAKSKYLNQITQNVTIEANAKLQVKLAELELEMFSDVKNGTHTLEVEEIKRLIDDVNNDILAAQASLELARNNKLGIKTLFELGYAGKSELDRSRLDFLQAESQYAAKLNKLKTQLSTLAKKETYERKMQLLQLSGNVATAERSLTQAIQDNEALLAQTKAATEAADELFKKEKERLARYQSQIDNSKITAPRDGMVAYATADSRRWWTEEIHAGSAVGPRQHILSLPNLKKMQVRTAVHESVLDQVKKGLPATVRVDAFPERSYRGSVLSVAVLANRESNDTKVYETIVTIDVEVEQLKPGMTAVVEIHAARLKDVISVPVQAVTQLNRDSWCYVDAAGTTERRLVELGRTNDKFVEIKDGLEVGDRVVLNPMAIVDDTMDEKPTISPDEGTDPPDGVGPQEPATTNPAPTARREDAASPSDKAPSGKAPGAATAQELRQRRGQGGKTGAGRPAGGRRPGGKGRPAGAARPGR